MLVLCDNIVVGILGLKARVQVSVRLIHTIKAPLDDACVLEGPSADTVALKGLIDPTICLCLLPGQKLDMRQVLSSVSLIDRIYQRWLSLAVLLSNSSIRASRVVGEVSSVIKLHVHQHRLVALNCLCDRGLISRLLACLDLIAGLLEMLREVLGK